MSDSDQPEAEYGLVMPFVVCQSNDGPYEDNAFVAGCWYGQIDENLQHGTAPLGRFDYTVPTPLVPQLDLLAMHHGYEMETEPWEDHPDEHTYVTFTLAGDPPATEGEPIWRYEVSLEGDEGASFAGEDPAGPWEQWTWAIFDGPDDPDHLVLSGVSDSDPTDPVARIVREHNIHRRHQ